MKKENLLNMVSVSNDYSEDYKEYLVAKEDAQEYENNEAYTIRDLENVQNWEYKGQKEIETGCWGFIFYDTENDEWYLVVENHWTSGNRNQISYATIETITEDEAEEMLE